MDIVDKDKICLLIVEDSMSAGKGLSLSVSDDFDIAGSCSEESTLFEYLSSKSVDVVLLDIDTSGLDWLNVCENLSVEHPDTIVIIVSAQDEPEYLRNAMAAGAKDYLVKPVADKELKEAVIRSYQKELKRRLLSRRAELGLNTMGKVLVVFSTKGGTGKTTLAVNLACSLKSLTGKKVIVADMNLQFGDVGVMLDIHPDKDSSMLAEEEKIDEEIVEKYLCDHDSGIRVLTAPAKPQDAEKVRADHVREIIEALKLLADWVIIDTTSFFRDIELTVLDLAETILVVTTPEITSLKDSKLCLDVMKDLEYPEEKVKVILNRADETLGISSEDIEKSLDTVIRGYVPSDGASVVPALNRGTPFVLGNPEIPVSKAVLALAAELADVPLTDTGKNSGLMSKIQKMFS